LDKVPSNLRFVAEDKAASFVLLENTRGLANRMNEEFIIVSFAENGGLQIKSRSW
jgi:hypothetical protein